MYARSYIRKVTQEPPVTQNFKLETPHQVNNCPEPEKLEPCGGCMRGGPTSAVGSIPVLTTSAPMSSRTASIWPRRVSAGTVWKPRTPCVFCSVTAVMADAPYTPQAWKVLRSAWMPAPPPESDPAIVSTRGTYRTATKESQADAQVLFLLAGAPVRWDLLSKMSTLLAAAADKICLRVL